MTTISRDMDFLALAKKWCFTKNDRYGIEEGLPFAPSVYIYKITNEINNKAYIAYTKMNPFDAFLVRAETATKGTDGISSNGVRPKPSYWDPLQIDMRNFGIENFSVKVVGGVNPRIKGDIFRRKNELILEYDTGFPRGYNQPPAPGAKKKDFDIEKQRVEDLILNWTIRDKCLDIHRAEFILILLELVKAEISISDNEIKKDKMDKLFEEYDRTMDMYNSASQSSHESWNQNYLECVAKDLGIELHNFQVLKPYPEPLALKKFL